MAGGDVVNDRSTVEKPPVSFDPNEPFTCYAVEATGEDVLNPDPKWSLVSPQRFKELEGKLPGIAEGFEVWSGPVFQAERFRRSVMRVSGIELCQRWISPEEVYLVYRSLAETPKHLADPDEVASSQEYEALTRYFQIAAEWGLAVQGWPGEVV
jgi:hypothetical protein